MYSQTNLTKEDLQAQMDQNHITLMTFFDFITVYIDSRHLFYQEFLEFY